MKETLYNKCMEIINSRIDRYKSELHMMKESMEEDDSKDNDDEGGGNSGSSGDQYAKIAQYLEEATQLKSRLKSIDIFQDNESVKVGSLVHCSNGNFFISVPLGKVELDGNIYFAISKEAPVGALLLNKKTGDSVSFNNNVFTIKEIF